MNIYLKLFSIFLLCTTAVTKGHSQKLRIAVAANAQFVAKTLYEAFEKKTGIQAELIVSSSGKLTAQIQQGAPFDIFLSADMKYPQALYEQKLTLEKPKIYAYGILVLWTLKEVDLSKGLQTITAGNIKKIAIANPKTAPYGEVSVQVMKDLKLHEKAKAKLVYGESIAQVNQYLLSGAADLAFTAKSVVTEPAMKGKGKWIEVDEKLYTPIAQGVVVLKTSKGKNLKDAQQFYQFLFSQQAQTIFTSYGYKIK